MSRFAWPFASGPGSNVTEAQWALMASFWLQSGVIAGSGNEFIFRCASGNMTGAMSSGSAWVYGHFFSDDAIPQTTIVFAPADPTYPRVDTVVIRLDEVAQTCDYAVLQGTPTTSVGATPVPAGLTQTNTRWEVPLYGVRINGGQTNLTDANVVNDYRAYAMAPKGNEAPRPNLLINGGFEIWQRGAGPFTAVGAYTADRWSIGIAPGTGTVSVTRDTTIADDLSQTSLKIVFTPGTSAYATIGQRIEAPNTLRGAAITVRARVLSTVVGAGIFITENASGALQTTGPLGVRANVWETITCTRVLGGTVTTLDVSIVCPAGATMYVDNVTYAIGSIPIAYTPPSLADDLARCERFYEVTQASARFTAAAAGNLSDTPVYWRQRKAVVPTVTISPGSNANVGTLNIPSVDTSGARFELTAAAAGDCYALNYVVIAEANI